MFARSVDQGLDVTLASNVARDDMRFAAVVADALHDRFAGVGFATGYDDLGAELRHAFGDRLTDAAA